MTHVIIGVLLRIVQLTIDGAGLDGLLSMYHGNPSTNSM